MQRRCMNTCVVCMSPALNESSALQRFEHGNAVKIPNEIMFDFYPGLPHIVTLFVTCECNRKDHCCRSRIRRLPLYAIGTSSGCGNVCSAWPAVEHDEVAFSDLPVAVRWRKGSMMSNSANIVPAF